MNKSKKVIDVGGQVDAREEHGVFLVRRVDHGAAGFDRTVLGPEALKGRLRGLDARDLVREFLLYFRRVEVAHDGHEPAAGAEDLVVVLLHVGERELLQGGDQLFARFVPAGVAFRIGVEAAGEFVPGLDAGVVRAALEPLDRLTAERLEFLFGEGRGGEKFGGKRNGVREVLVPRVQIHFKISTLPASDNIIIN